MRAEVGHAERADAAGLLFRAYPVGDPIRLQQRIEAVQQQLLDMVAAQVAQAGVQRIAEVAHGQVVVLHAARVAGAVGLDDADLGDQPQPLAQAGAQGHGGADQLSGPVGIAKMTRQVADIGFLPLLNLVAILSVSIGLANLFPIPLRGPLQ